MSHRKSHPSRRFRAFAAEFGRVSFKRARKRAHFAYFGPFRAFRSHFLPFWRGKPADILKIFTTSGQRARCLFPVWNPGREQFRKKSQLIRGGIPEKGR
jgi:hypothetical protein